MATRLRNELKRLRAELARAQVANAALGPVQVAVGEAASDLDVTAYLADVLRRATGIVSARAGSVLPLDEAGHQLGFVAVHGGGGHDPVRQSIAATAGVVPAAAARRRRH